MNELDDFFDIVTVSRDRQKLERTIFRLERAHDFAEQLLSSDTSPIAQIVNRWVLKLDYNLKNNLFFSSFSKYYFTQNRNDHNLHTTLQGWSERQLASGIELWASRSNDTCEEAVAEYSVPPWTSWLSSWNFIEMFWWWQQCSLYSATTTTIHKGGVHAALKNRGQH